LSDLLFENEHYTVTIQDITDSNNKVSRGYAVLNKGTGVTEYESFNSVESVMFSKDMSAHLSEIFAEQAVDNVLN